MGDGKGDSDGLMGRANEYRAHYSDKSCYPNGNNDVKRFSMMA